MKLYSLSVAVLAGLFLSACSVSSEVLDLKQARAEALALAEATEWTLFALNPDRLTQEQKQATTTFHGWGVLGEATLSDASARAELTEALNRGIAKNGDSTVAACFNPRHGVAIPTSEGSIALVICFECLQIQVYGEDGEKRATTLTMEDPKGVFNRVWLEHGLTPP